VPGFRLQGFLLREKSEKDICPFIVLSGKIPGTIVKNLDIQAKGRPFGIMISSVDISLGEEPLVIERCTIRGVGRGIAMTASKCVCLRDNLIVDCDEGIQIKYTVMHTQITGNVVWNCQIVAIDIEDLKSESQGNLIANNTLFDSQALIRVFDYVPYEEHVSGQIAFHNNLLFEATNADMVLLRSTIAHVPVPADGGPLVKLWDFKHNRRDFSGIYSSAAFPLAPDDKRIDKPELITREASNPDFLCPIKGSELATGGVGGHLPKYIGAVPPENTERWNWDKTWKALSKLAAEKRITSKQVTTETLKTSDQPE